MFLPAPARLLAAHRARESARRDAAFSDPYARVLLGAIDDRFSRILSGADTTEWLFTARTVAFDRLIDLLPDQSSELSERGKLYDKLGAPGAALADYERYLSVEPDGADRLLAQNAIKRLKQALAQRN